MCEIKREEDEPMPQTKTKTSSKKDLSSGELTAFREIKHEVRTYKKIGAFWIPILISVGLGIGTLLPWLFGVFGEMRYKSMMADVQKAVSAAVAPLSRDIKEIRRTQVEISKKVDRVEIQQATQAEKIRDIKKKLEQ